jgi:hypothetical protein
VSAAEKPPVEQLREAFYAEAAASGHNVKRALIVDDEVTQQKMYLEFLMYRDLFTSWGWAAEIAESKEFGMARRRPPLPWRAD